MTTQPSRKILWTLAITAMVFIAATCSYTAAWGQTILVTEDFESGATGWADNSTDSAAAPWTQFLGRFSMPNGQSQYKTFTGLPGGSAIVNVEFDFYRMDSWDGEYFQVYIDDVQVANDWYKAGSNSTPANAVALGGRSNQVFERWDDQRFRYSFTTTVTDTDIKLGFGDTINSGISDESWGIDNVLISYLVSSGDRTWNSDATADWSSLANWDDGTPPPSLVPATTIPTASENVYVPNGTVNVTGNEAAFSLDIGATLPTGNPTVDVNASGTLNVAAATSIGASGTLDIYGDFVTGGIASTGDVFLRDGGSLTTGGGTISDLEQFGTSTLDGGGVTITNLTTDTQFNGTSDFNATNTTLKVGTVFNQTSGTATLGNVTGSSGLTKDGDGTVLLNTGNSYAGTTTVNGGTLHITNGGALGDTTAGTIINDGGALRLGGSGNFTLANDEDITIRGNGNGTTNAALFNQGNDNNIDGLVIVHSSGAKIRTDNNRLRIRGGLEMGGSLNIDTDGGTVVEIQGNSVIGSSALTGSGTLTKEGDGTIDIRTNSLSYSGQININNGVIDVNNQAYGLGTGGINIDGDATLRLRSNVNLVNNITLNGTANSGNGQDQGRIRNDDNDNTLSGTIGWNTNSRVDVDGGTSLTLSGVISGGGDINKVDTGQLNLTNPGNTNSGALNVGGGTVQVSSVGALGNPSAIDIAGGATLDLAGAGAHSIGPTNVAGTIRSSDSSKQLNSAISVNGGTIDNATGGTTFTVNGAISLGSVGDMNFSGPGDIVVNSPFGNGSVPYYDNGLRGTYYNTNDENNLTNIGNGTGTDGLLSLTPAVTQDPYNGPLDFRNNFGIGFDDLANNHRFDNKSLMWEGVFTPDASGSWGLGMNDRDDRARVWIDLDGDGIFENDAAAGATNGNELVRTSNGLSYVTLTGGQQYDVAFAFLEWGGSEAIEFRYDPPSATGNTIINPSSLSQDGLFTTLVTPDNNVVKNGSGTLTLAAANTYNGTTTIEGGTLVAAHSTALGIADGTAATGTSVAAGATLGLQGGVTIANEAITLDGTGSAGQPGALANISGNNVVAASSPINAALSSQGDIGIGSTAGTLSIDAPIDLQYSKLTVSGAGNTTIGGVISGNGSDLVQFIDGGLQGYYYDTNDAPNSVNASTNLLAPISTLEALTPQFTALTPWIDFGSGTESAPGDGTVLNRGGSNGSIFAGLGIGTDSDNIAGLWTGYVNAPEDATYRFTTRSDDGSVLFIDGVMVVNNNYNQGMTNRNGDIALTAGAHEIKIGYFEGGGGSGMQASWEQLDGTNPFSREILGPDVLGQYFHFVSDNSLVKEGSGILTLSANNTYNGTTFVNDGILVATADGALGTTDMGTIVSNGGTLQLDNVAYTTPEALSLAGNGYGAIGALSNSGTSSYNGPITLAGNASIGNGANASDSLTLTGGIDKNGYNVSFIGAGTTTINTAGISGAADVIVDGTTVDLDVASTYDGPTFIRNGGVLNANVVDAMPTAPRTAVTLDDSGSGSSILNINDNNTIASLTSANTSSTVNIASGRTLTIGDAASNTTYAGVISGAGSLIKDGGSTLTLTNRGNNYSGGTIVNDGILTLNAGNSTNSLVGTGLLTINAGGQVNTYVNSLGYNAAKTDVFINGGTLNQVSADSHLRNVSMTAGTMSGSDFRLHNTVTVNAAGTSSVISVGVLRLYEPTIEFNVADGSAAVDLLVSSNIANDGQLVKTGAGTMELSGSNSYTGGTTLSSGTLLLENTNALPGNLTYTNSARLTVGNGANNGSAGVVTFDPNNGSQYFDLNGNTFTVDGINNSSTANNRSVVQNNRSGTTGTLIIDSNSDHYYKGIIRDQGGTLAVTKKGTGTQTFVDTLIDYHGATKIEAGTLHLLNLDDAWTSGFDIASGATLEIETASRAFQTRAPISFTGGGTLVKTGSNELRLGSNNQAVTMDMAAGSLIDVQQGVLRNEYYAGGGTWSSNEASMNIASGATVRLWDADITIDTLTGSGTMSKGWDGTHTLTIGSAGSLDAHGLGNNFSGSIIDHDNGRNGTLNLVKIGSGTQILSGNNTYTGSTTVSAGSLLLDGGSITSDVTVQNGGNFGGTGAVYGSITIDDGGTHAPGMSAGIQPVSGDYNLSGLLAIEFAGNGGVAGTDFDQVQVSGGGNVALGGTSSLSTSWTGTTGTFAPTFGEVFAIISNEGVSTTTTGAFNGLPAGSVVTIDGVDLKIYYDNGTNNNDVVLVSTNVSATPINLYVDDSFTGPATVDGDREAGGVQTAYNGTNAFADPTSALAAYPGTEANIIVNGGTYASADLSGANVTLNLVADGVSGTPDTTITTLTGQAGDIIKTQFYGTPGNGDLIVQNGSYGGQITGDGSLTKDGSGTLILSGANTYSGGTTISEEALRIGNAGALGQGTVTIEDGANLLLWFKSGSNTVANDIVLNGMGSASGGKDAIYTDGGGAGYGEYVLSGTITLNDDSNIGGHNINHLRVTGQITGVGGLTKGGGRGDEKNTLILTNTANDYQGDTSITKGTLQLGNAGVIPDGSALSISGGATFDLAGYDETIGGLTGSGTVTNDSNTNATLTVSFGPGTDVFDGIIQNGTGTGKTGLTKSGSGTLTLSGANTYTGTTTVNGGTLRLVNDAIDTVSGRDYAPIAAGATLEFNQTAGGASNLGAIDITGGGTFLKTGSQSLQLTSSGAVVDMGPTGLYHIAEGTFIYGGGTPGNWTSNQGDLQIDSGAEFRGESTALYVDALNGGGNLTIGGNDFSSSSFNGPGLTVGVNDGSGFFSGTISNAGNGNQYSLVKVGSGTQVLSGANTYTGLTDVQQGTLKLQGAAFSTTARDYTIASGAVLNIDGNTGVASGTTTISGDGTLLVTGGIFGNEGPNNPKGSGRNITMNLGSGALIDIESGAEMINGGWANTNWTNNLADLNVDGTFDLWDGQQVFVDAVTGSGLITANPGSGGTQNITVGVDDGSGVFNGRFSNANRSITLTKVGSGVQTLAGTADNNGLVATVNEGTLVLGKTSSGGVHALGGGGTVLTINSGGTAQLAGTGGDQIYYQGDIVINNGGTFDINGRNEGFDQMTMTGAGSGNGAITNSSTTAGTLTGTFTNNGSSIGGIGDITLNGSVNGNTLTKIDGNTVTLSGTTDNNSLLAVVNAGTLVLGKTSSGGVHSVGGGGTVLTINNGAVAQLGGSGNDQIYYQGDVVVNTGGLFDMNGRDEGFDALSGGGTITNNGTADSILTIGQNNSGSTYDGLILDGTSAISLVKTGNGEFILTNTGNTYSGGTTVNGGMLRASDRTIGGGNLTLENNSIFFNVSGGGGGAFNDNNFQKTTTLGPGGGGFRSGWGSMTISGQITGVGSLTIVNDGAITLTNTGNDYAGDTIIGRSGSGNNATLVLGASEVIPNGAGTGNVVFNNPSGAGTAMFNLNGYSETINGLVSGGASANVVDNTAAGAVTLTLGDNNANATYAGTIRDTGGDLSLTKIGGGTQVLTGTNTYVGPTTINTGTLQIGAGGAGSIVSQTTVNSGGTLAGTGLVSNSVSVNGTVSPGDNSGNAIGTLTVNSATFNTGSTLAIQLDPANPGNFTPTGWGGVATAAASDTLDVTGDLTLGGTLDLRAVSDSWARGQEFNILDFVLSATNDADGDGEIDSHFEEYIIPYLYSDDYAILTHDDLVGGQFLPDLGETGEGFGGSLTWDFTDLYSQGIIRIVPEPSTWAIFGLGLLALGLIRRRKK